MTRQGGALIALAAMFAVYAVASFTTIGQQVDASAIDHHPYDRTTTRDEHLYSVLMDCAALVLAPVLAWKARRRPALLLHAGVVAAGVFVSATVLKAALPRPDLLPGFQFGNSFPSGHAAVALTLALFVVLVDNRRSMVVLAASSAALLGTFAVFEPIHRPSDVLGGFLLAIAALAITKPTTSVAVPARALQPSQMLLVAGAQVCGLTVLGTIGAARAGIGLVDFGPGYAVAAVLIVLVADILLSISS